MCGIVAAFSPEKTLSREALYHALSALKHRGPDAQALWQNRQGTVSLGHARLSIIDLGGGQQPLSNPQNNIHAVVNGEIYDYQRLRRQLAEEGYQFRTASDSEVLLALYERYGVDCLAHLRGEFAFVIWDERNQWVFAARDRFGIKPLYYSQQRDALYLASEVKALAPLGLPLRWHEDMLVQDICGFPLNNSSLFADVAQIPPGHYLLKSQGSRQMHLRSYWDFDYSSSSELAADQRSQAEVVAGFRHVFDEAVRLRLQADVPVASYLSGGLDSCSILGTVKDLSQKSIPAFTLCFDDADYDEAAQAREMAEFCGSSFNPIAISQNDIADHYEDTVWHAEKMVMNGHAVAKYLLSKAVNQAGIKVVLTGEGSDEIFAGYAHFRQDMIFAAGDKLAAGDRAQLLADLNAKNKVSAGFLMASDRSSEGGADHVAKSLGFVPAWMQSFAKLGQMMRGFLAPELLGRVEDRQPADFFFASMADFGRLKERDPLNQSLYLWSKAVLPHYLLTVLGDRMEMAHSVEGRVPFLDHKVVEYLAKVPVHYKIKGMTEKYLLREAMRERLTATMYQRQKHPFIAPPSTGRKHEKMSQLIHDTLRGPGLKSLPFFNHAAIIKALDKFDEVPAALQNSYDIAFNMVVSAVLLNRAYKLS